MIKEFHHIPDFGADSRPLLFGRAALGLGIVIYERIMTIHLKKFHLASSAKYNIRITDKGKVYQSVVSLKAGREALRDLWEVMDYVLIN